MTARRTTLAGLAPAGFQTITLANSTAVGLNGTMRLSQVLDLSVETNHARMRADGTAPALTTGVLLVTGTYRWEGFNGTSSLKFQRSTGTCTINVQGYRIQKE